jgi:hypothetical protein
MNIINKLLLLSFLGVNIINCSEGIAADEAGLGTAVEQGQIQGEAQAALNRQVSAVENGNPPSTPVGGLQVNNKLQDDALVRRMIEERRVAAEQEEPLEYADARQAE